MNNYPKPVFVAHEIDEGRGPEEDSPVERFAHFYNDDGWPTESYVLDADDELPASASPFPPPTGNNQIAWFDGRGWRLVMDIMSMDIIDAQTHLINLCSNIRYLDDPKYSIVERSMWERQYNDAISYQANGNSDSLIYLNAVAEETGEDIAELAQKIIDRYLERERQIAALNAKVQRLRTQINEAETVQELPSYAEILRMSM